MRMHGSNAEMTKEFYKKAKESAPIAMISEGTRINIEKTGESESTVYTFSKNQIQDSKMLTIIDFNFKDVDRFRTFYQIAQETNKNMVISFKHACFLERYHLDEKLNVPNSTGDNIFLFKPKRQTGTYDESDYSDKYIKKRINFPNVLTAEEIAQKPEEYMIVMNYWYFNTLADLKPKSGLYIHSLSEPFNEEMEISYKRMRNWLNYFNLKFFQAHCSGHMCGNDLKELIEEVQPKILFPIHTEWPGMFRSLTPKTKMIKKGKTFTC
jgi:ribonuclease J